MMGTEMRRRLFTLFGVGAAFALVRFSRLLQVGAFATVAGVRRFLGTSASSHPGAHADEWERLRPPEKKPIATLSRVAITHHPWYQYHRAGDACICLAEAAALGVGYLRSDVRWKDVLPDAKSPDEDAFRWYRSYFTAVRDWYGMQPLFVLSEAPNLVNSLDDKGRMSAWRFYVEQVVARLGDLCRVYQVLNEPNNPVFRFFPKAQQCEAIKVAAQVIKSRVPRSQILVNFLEDLPTWRQTLTRILGDCGSAIDIVAIDHYPGTWALSATADWSSTIEIASAIRTAASGSIWAGRKLAIIETGYSTNIVGLRTERHQSDYFVSLEQATKMIDLAMGARGIDLLGLYEICDENSAVRFDPEAHFGLVTSSFKRKLAFQTVQGLCARIGTSKDQSTLGACFVLDSRFRD